VSTALPFRDVPWVECQRPLLPLKPNLPPPSQPAEGTPLAELAEAPPEIPDLA